ncbi:hypothetical protein A2U01_0070708, partial [Trifolium medium]|nr:hypothetical protein [Trifolium medium]
MLGSSGELGRNNE